MANLNLSNTPMFAIVDDDLYDYLSKFTWRFKDRYVCRTINYAKVNGKRKSATIFLHREVLNAPSGLLVDHLNHNVFDNRRCNLRICNSSENSSNRLKSNIFNDSIYKGVNKARKGKWKAHIKFKGLDHRLGTYTSEEDAARAYNVKARELFGEFACYNDVSDWENFEIKLKVKSSKYKGVTKRKDGKFIAYTTKHLGVFSSEDDARKCVEETEVKRFE